MGTPLRTEPLTTNTTVFVHCCNNMDNPAKQMKEVCMLSKILPEKTLIICSRFISFLAVRKRFYNSTRRLLYPSSAETKLMEFSSNKLYRSLLHLSPDMQIFGNALLQKGYSDGPLYLSSTKFILLPVLGVHKFASYL